MTKVIEVNVLTGKVTKRPHTQKELDYISTTAVRVEAEKQVKDKENDIRVKREAAIEEVLMTGTSVKAKAYQNAKNA